MKPVEQTPWGRFENLEALSGSRLHDGRFSVAIRGGRFEAWLQRQPGDRLWVLLSAARDPRQSALPTFNRWSWASRFQGSVLCVSDPTLYLDPERMRIGWYVGTASEDWQGGLADLVRTVASLLSLPTHRVICYGSSAGGFASLMLAARLGDATAVAINPQTEVLNYARPAVDRLLALAFDGRRDDELSAEHRLRLSAVSRYELAPDARCLYVQNRLDRVHLARHFKPFALAMGIPIDGGSDESGRLVAELYDDERGHAPEPSTMVGSLIARAVALADAALPSRFVPTSALRCARSDLPEPTDPARLGLTRRSDAARSRIVPGTAPVGLDPGWRVLDTALVHNDVVGLTPWLEPLQRWIDADEAGAGSNDAWETTLPATRALRLAGLLSLRRAGADLWPVTQWPCWDRAFEKHLRRLLDGLAQDATPASPLDLHAVAALLQHLDGMQARRFAEQRWRAAVSSALNARFTPEGVLRSHTPSQQRSAVRAWSRCATSGWFDETPLIAMLPAMRRAAQALRGLDGRPLPLGEAVSDGDAIPGPTPGDRSPRNLSDWSGQILFRDAGQGRLLHLMAGNRTTDVVHDDAMSVLWHDGAALLTDPGRSSAASRTMIRYLRSSAAHNTVSIEGRPPAAGGLSNRLLVAEEADGLVHIVARKTDKRWSATHARHLWHHPGRWLLLLDVLTARTVLDWTRWLHFGPDLVPEGPACWLLPDGRRLTVHTACADALQENTLRGATEPRVQGWLCTPDGVVPGWATGHAVRAERTAIATLLVLGDSGSTLRPEPERRLRAEVRAGGTVERLRLTWDLESSQLARDVSA